MRKNLLLFPLGGLLSLVGCAPGTQPGEPDLPPSDSASPVQGGWAQTVGARLDAANRDFVNANGAFVANNRSWGFTVRLSDDGARLTGPSEEIGLRFDAWGRDGAMEPAALSTPALGDCLSEQDASGDCLRRIELDRGPVLECTVCEVLALPGTKVHRSLSKLLARTGADMMLIAPGGASSGVIQAPLGPMLTWRPIGRPGTPKMRDLMLTMGDLELF